MVRPVKDTEMMISLQQTGGRLPIITESRDRKTYFDYPFAETLHYAALTIFKVKSNSNLRTLENFDKDDIIYLSPIKRERENAGRVHLKKNETYIIVPSTEKGGMSGEFYLSIYIDQHIRDVEIKRVFHATDRNELKDEILPFFIPEEAEKISNRAPTWKLTLVKESLKYMVTDDDDEAFESD